MTVPNQNNRGSRQPNSPPEWSQHASLSQPFALRPSAKLNEEEQNAASKKKEEAFQAQLSVRLLCPQCPPDESANIVEEFSSGDLVCGNCGLVLGDRIVDTRSEWRTFANEDGDDPSRVGSAQNPLLGGLQTHSFETRISSKDGYTGQAIALQRAASRVSTSQGRALLDAFHFIQQKGESISLERHVIDTAKQTYSAVLKHGILKNKKLDAIVAAAFFVACKMHKVPRTFPEICLWFNISKKEVRECFKEISKTFSVNAKTMNGENDGNGNGNAGQGGSGSGSGSGSAIAPTDPVDLIGRFSNHLGIKLNGFTKSSELLSHAVKDCGVLAGSSPRTPAACILLMACTLWDGEARRSPKQIASVTGVTEATIKKSYKKLIQEQKKNQSLINQGFLDRYKGRIDINRLDE